METDIESIHSIIKDYQNDIGVQITKEDIQLWALQFGTEAGFVLNEFSHILSRPGVYLSKQTAYESLERKLLLWCQQFKYSSMQDFIMNTCFFDVQQSGKSQGVILDILKNLLAVQYSLNIADYEDEPKLHYIYIDDILATGGTIHGHLNNWLQLSTNGELNYQLVIDRKISLSVYCFCMHNFAKEMINWRFKYIKDGLQNRIYYLYDYLIQDHTRFNNQSFNCFIPLENQLSERSKKYYNELEGEKQPQRAFRPINFPVKDALFSSKEARIKLESIFIEKGVGILSQVSELGANHRPLGATYPSYRTFGTGTAFFTWRNIPNNSPIVFWWNNHGWRPLFPLINRGNN